MKTAEGNGVFDDNYSYVFRSALSCEKRLELDSPTIGLLTTVHLNQLSDYQHKPTILTGTLLFSISCAE